MTQKEKVLKYMRENGTITTAEAFWKLNVTRLSEMIRLLKVDGYVIGKSGVTKKRPDGSHVYYERFWIAREPSTSNKSND